MFDAFNKKLSNILDKKPTNRLIAARVEETNKHISQLKKTLTEKFEKSGFFVNHQMIDEEMALFGSPFAGAVTHHIKNSGEWYDSLNKEEQGIIYHYLEFIEFGTPKTAIPPSLKPYKEIVASASKDFLGRHPITEKDSKGHINRRLRPTEKEDRILRTERSMTHGAVAPLLNKFRETYDPEQAKKIGITN